ncbi:MAG: hydrogenase maturation nickel metallochaperone HypA, partial [Clostridiales bacterium]|nr:hydrogenase maturation nickel metallochaperone HypA [Clostridiales bacterium]
PNCGGNVSDKASVCPGCGNEMLSQEIEIQKVLITCEDCNTEYMEGMDKCPSCGCPTPILIPQESPQKVEITCVDISQKSKYKIKRVGIIIAIVAVICIGVTLAIKHNAEVEASAYADTYLDKMKNASFIMLVGASEAESAGNLIKRVWYNAIYKETDAETDPYTRRNGYFTEDFNEALDNLFSTTSFINNISSIEENQKKVNISMKELRNPPKEYEEAYDVLNDYYDAYITLTNLVINPTGSLKSFSENFNSADANAVNCYEKMKLYLD